jgi:hypothetical protein
MKKKGWLFRTITRFAGGIVPAIFSIAGGQACAAEYPAGGPYYYGSWASYFVPMRPVEPLSLAEAQKRPVYYEAFFDAEGRIVRFAKHSKGRVLFQTSYSYRADKSFEERGCSGGALVVTVYDKKGKEQSSTRTPGGCPVGQGAKGASGPDSSNGDQSKDAKKPQ